MFGSLDDGCATVHKMLQAGVVPAAAEIMDRFCLEAVARNTKTEVDPGIEACLVIEIDGDSDEALDLQAKRIEELARESGAVALSRGPIPSRIRRALGRPAGDQLGRGGDGPQPAGRGYIRAQGRLSRGGAPHQDDLREV